MSSPGQGAARGLRVGGGRGERHAIHGADQSGLGRPAYPWCAPRKPGAPDVPRCTKSSGFDKNCLLDPSVLAKSYKYDRTTWWNEISEEPLSSKNSIVSIHNHTLRMLAKWICMVVHPRSDLRLCSLPELQYLFAMAKSITLSPIMSMLAHWQKMIAGRSSIDITTLVTHMATHVKALDNTQVTYLPWEEEYQLKVGVDHFVQGHMMHEGPDAKKGTSSSQCRQYNNSMTDTIEHSAARTSTTLSPSWNLPHELRRNIRVFYSRRYEHCWKNIRIRCSPRTLPPPGMQDSHGPQQDQLSIDLAHNTELTQQNWSMNTSLLHDTTSIFTHLGLGQHLHPPQQPQQPQQPPLQQHYAYPPYPTTTTATTQTSAAATSAAVLSVPSTVLSISAATIPVPVATTGPKPAELSFIEAWGSTKDYASSKLGGVSSPSKLGFSSIAARIAFFNLPSPPTSFSLTFIATMARCKQARDAQDELSQTPATSRPSWPTFIHWCRRRRSRHIFIDDSPTESEPHVQANWPDMLASSEAIDIAGPNGNKVRRQRQIANGVIPIHVIGQPLYGDASADFGVAAHAAHEAAGHSKCMELVLWPHRCCSEVARDLYGHIEREIHQRRWTPPCHHEFQRASTMSRNVEHEMRPRDRARAGVDGSELRHVDATELVIKEEVVDQFG
ncbi:putative retrotransposon [Panicum miliaceum]|uniref:Retrotransposon n=1 Tax=Panicum miliaceum TaxID=4540 RepID=A0A3L6RYR9_PANMI|nr:putative retrotransposon [Panicum miliaceum]